MDAGERQAIVEAAVAAVQALDNQGLYSRGAVRPERFPSNTYSNWLEWKRHFAWICEANGWTDEQSRRALPTCLTSWALDEFSAMPQQYRIQVQDQPAPSLQRMFGYLDPRMQPYRTQRTARAEFKSTVQDEKEGIREFSRRVRSIGEIANTNLNRNARDDMNREQFIDGLWDAEVQELLQREDPQTFADAVNRALSLDAINRTARNRQRRKAGVAFANFDSNMTGPSNYQRNSASNRMMAVSTSSPSSADETTRHEIEEFRKKQEISMNNMASMVRQFMETVSAAVQSEAADGSVRASQSTPQRSHAPRRAENAVSGNCFRCGQQGHLARTCPLNQDHLN